MKPMKEKSGLVIALGGKPPGGGGEDSEGGGSEYDADAKALLRALETGNGGRMYQIIKGLVDDCLSDSGGGDEDEDEM